MIKAGNPWIAIVSAWNTHDTVVIVKTYFIFHSVKNNARKKKDVSTRLDLNDLSRIKILSFFLNVGHSSC